MRLDVYHHFVDEGCPSRHNEVISLLRAIKAQGELILSTVSQEILDLAAKIDAATNAVAARLTALQAQITNSMSPDELTAVQAALQAEIDKLTALGADPANPVPPAS